MILLGHSRSNQRTREQAEQQVARVDPFLKWAGGKRWATGRLCSEIPKNIGTYFEPFLGGGSVFFALAPNRAVLSDANPALINAYRIVQTQYAALDRWLLWLHERHSKELYYRIRSRTRGGEFWSALRFIYLNRACWNGLYRVNMRGEFNVPIGTKDEIRYKNGLTSQALALRSVDLRCCDFAETLAKANAGDFAYIDPPYTVKHNNNGFIKYNEKIFSWADQERLRDEVRRAIDRGVNILVSNAAHDSIRELYRNVGTLIEVERSSVLAASPSFRKREKELLIRCY